MTVEVEFVGGPADGHSYAVMGDEPAHEVKVYGRPSTEHRYQRIVSPRDDGPLWLYTYAGSD